MLKTEDVWERTLTLYSNSKEYYLLETENASKIPKLILKFEFQCFMIFCVCKEKEINTKKGRIEEVLSNRSFFLD